ncbi:hypothetical protein [Gemmata sp.]|uniref:hypothetical protein n=1 Tax=Gemmata sp. TaxID=1914242 RepID=UPI003F71803A
MGGTCWSDDEYHERAVSRKKSGRDAFEHHEDIRTGRVQSGVHQKMNPRGVIARESRDSEAHPESHAVAVLFDVTGSMQSVPRVLQQNLPRLMNLLIRKGYLAHPQIMVGAIGDATCDQAPLQIGQFESGLEIEDDLAKLYLEGGGGGHITESYELAMYFMAWHTAIDCFEKRGKKGYLFVIGDEAPYPKVKHKEIRAVIGDGIQADLPLEEVIEKLQQRYEVYYIIPRMTNHYGNAEIRKRWTHYLGQNVLKLEDPAGICELIASVIGLTEEKVDLTEVESDLQEAGATPTVVQAVSASVAPVASSRGRK